MTDFQSPLAPALPLFLGAITWHGPNSALQAAGQAALPPAVRTWVANLVSYAPVIVPYPYPVKRVFWVNGSTITTTNVDFGIYTWDGTRIYNTGSTAMSGASAVQYVTPGTDFILSPARYYFAWTCNGTTSRGYAGGSTSANAPRLAGMLEETTGGFGLPATMTPVAYARSWGPSVCGVTRTTTGF